MGIWSLEPATVLSLTFDVMTLVQQLTLPNTDTGYRASCDDVVNTK